MWKDPGFGPSGAISASEGSSVGVVVYSLANRGKTNVYTEENLRNCGYALRNWLNFLAVREVYFHVLHPSNEKPRG